MGNEPQNQNQDSQENFNENIKNDDKDKNLKAEMDRKFGNMDTKLADVAKLVEESNTANQQMFQQIAQGINPAQNQQATAASDANLEDLRYSNPQEYDRLFAKQIKDSVLKETKGMIDNTVQQRDAMATVTNRLVMEYPEIQNTDSDIRKAADAIHDALPKNLQNSAEGYEVAVLRAAAQTGTLPKSKQQNNDNFVFGSGNDVKPKPQEVEITDSEKKLASKMGLNLSDKKVQEKLKAKKKYYAGVS